MIYRITNSYEWQRSRHLGYFSSQDLAEEGFIHCSAIHQVIEVANRLYRGETNLVVLEIEESRLTAAIKWEDTHNSGELFPHVYGVINLDAISGYIELDPGRDGNFYLPN